MRIVAALGGNAMLRRGQAMTAENQRANIRRVAVELAAIAEGNDLIITHGNGPQIGLLALQGAAYDPGNVFPLDILDAETEGMIGYLIEQEMTNALPPGRRSAALLTQIEVDPLDPAFRAPSKLIGPVYAKTEADAVAEKHGWLMSAVDGGYRRVVPSPRPRRIFELDIIELLVAQGIIVICAGGGGIATVRRDDGSLFGIEAVIDKDHASGMLAAQLKADAFLMLTDVAAVKDDWGAENARTIRRAAPGHLAPFAFQPGSMQPKVTAACEFAEAGGGFAGIGRLEDAQAILRGEAGTVIAADADALTWWD
jgi:carbamate kinase